MKRLISTILLVAALTTFFTSCSKEEYFDGQTWESEKIKYSFTDDGDKDNYELNITLSFTGKQVSAKIKYKNSYTYSYYDEWGNLVNGSGTDSDSFTAKGTYTYDKKNVSMKLENDDWELDETWRGKVDKDKMTLNVLWDWIDLDEQVVFTKR